MTQDFQDEASFQAWTRDPLTERIFNYLRLCKQATQEDWASQRFEGDTEHKSTVANAKAVGGLIVIKSLLELKWEDILAKEKEIEDAKQFRYSPERQDDPGGAG